MTENNDKKTDDFPYEEIAEVANTFSASFTNFTEIEGIIIRGHILIEQQLSRSIELTVSRGSEYIPEKFSFAQKSIIANMLGISEGFKIELNALNKLRNQIAHSLKFDDKLVDQIVNEVFVKKSDLFTNKKDKLNSLKISISFICGAVCYGHHLAKTSMIKKHIKLLNI